MSLELFVSDYTGTTNDRLKQLLAANGASGTTIPDMWLEFLDALGFSTGTLNDRLRQFLLDYTAASDTGQTIDDLWSLIDAPYSAAEPFVPLLDTYATGAVIALSTRLMKTGETECIRVLRASDSTQQTIGFSGQSVDSAAITAFCSGTVGRVHTWFDQSGTEDFRADTPNHPKVYDGGLIQVNSKVAALFTEGVGNLSAMFPSSGSGIDKASMAVFAVVQNIAQTNTWAWPVMCDNTESFGIMIGSGAAFSPDLTGPAAVKSGAIRIQDGADMAADSIHVLSFVTDGVNGALYIDGVSEASGAIGTVPVYMVAGGYTNMRLCELVVYTSDQSANRAAIEAHMAAYWGITI